MHKLLLTVLLIMPMLGYAQTYSVNPNDAQNISEQKLIDNLKAEYNDWLWHEIFSEMDDHGVMAHYYRRKSGDTYGSTWRKLPRSERSLRWTHMGFAERDNNAWIEQIKQQKIDYVKRKIDASEVREN